MFHWICPECGREIAPTVRECPVCDGGAEQAELVLAGVVEASARTLQGNSSAGASQASHTKEVDAEGDVPATESEYAVEPPRLADAVNPLPEPVKWSRTPGSTRGLTPGLTPGLTAGLTHGLSSGLDAEESSVEQNIAERTTTEPAANGQIQDVNGQTRAVNGRAANGQANSAPVQGPRLSVEPLIPEILDAKAALDRAVEAKASMRGMSGRAVEGLVNRPAGAEGKAVASRAIESRAVETKPVEAKPIEANPVDAQVIETRRMEGSPVAEVKPKAAGTRRVDTTTVETKTVESGTVNVQPAAASPVDADSPAAAESKHAGAERATGAQPPARPPFDLIPLLAKLSSLALPKIAASPAKIESRPTDASGNEAGKEAPRPSMPETTAREMTPGPDVGIEEKIAAPSSDQPGPPAKDGVTPETAPCEPLLPTFAPPPRESLNALLADAGMLDDEGAADEGAKTQADPPVAGKLRLPAISSAHLPAVAPEVVSIGSVAPRVLPSMAPARDLVRDVASPATTPGQEIARKMTGLRLVESRLPMARPSARALKFSAAAQPVPASPRAGAVRAPRSPAPFLAPQLAGLVKYAPLEKNPIRPVAPPVDLRRSDTTPRITLPGPMLTRALVSFKDRELAPIFLEARAFRKRFAYGWLAIVLAVGTVLGVGFSSMISTPARATAEARPASEATQGAKATVQANPVETNTSEPAPLTGAPAHARGSNPLSKVIEVTGLRIVTDPARKQQVEYLVVNHSSARFPDATIYVTLRAADARVGQAPLCRFSFAAPDLGPFEAKEMISAIEKTNRTANLPEWQDLRAEIEIGQ